MTLMHSIAVAVKSKRTFLTTLALSFCQPSDAQEVSGIYQRTQQLQEEMEDTSRIVLLGDLAFDYLFLNLDSAAYYADLLMREAEKTPYKAYYADALSVNGTVQRYLGNGEEGVRNLKACYEIRKDLKDSVGMYKVLGNLGNAYNTVYNDYQQSLDYYGQSLRIQKNLGHISAMTVTYVNISTVYHDQGKYPEALHYLQKAELLAERYSDDKTLGRIYLNMGNLFEEVGQNEKSLQYLKKGMDFRLQTGDSAGVANALQSIASVYETQGDYSESYRYCKESLRIREHLNDSLGLSTICGNLAVLLLRLDEKEEAEEMAKRGLIISENIGYEQGIAFAATVIGEIHLARNNPAEAALHCLRAYEIWSQYETKTDRMDACKCLYLAHDQLQNTSLALQYLEEYTQLEDTLNTQNNAVEVVRLQTQYEFEKKNFVDSLKRESIQRIEKLNQMQKERETQDQIRFQQTLLTFGTIVFLLILAGALLYFRIKRLKQKAESEQKLAESELMALRAQMNPHFIFNCLSSIQNYVEKRDFDRADKYLGKFNKLLRLVLNTSRKPFISLKNEVSYLHLYIELENLRQNNRFDYRIRISEHIDQDETEIPVMLIQPYVENAIKHGLAMKEQDGLLEIDMDQQKGQLTITVKDNGIGRRRAQQFRKNDLKRKEHVSLGLQITQERLNLLYQGNVNQQPITVHDLYEPDGTAAGTLVTLVLPVSRNGMIHD